MFLLLIGELGATPPWSVTLFGARLLCAALGYLCGGLANS